MKRLTLRALLVPVLLMAADVGARAEVYLDLPAHGPRIATVSLGLNPIGQARRISVNGVPARLEIYRTALPHREVARRLEAELTAWFAATRPAAAGDGFDLPGVVYGPDHSTLAVAVVGAPGEPSATVSFHARSTPGGDTELTVTHYLGFPLAGVDEAQGLAASLAMDGEAPALAVAADGGTTVAFEGRWALEERLDRRIAALRGQGWAVSGVAREPDGVFFAASGAEGVIQGFLSLDETGIVTEVMTVVGTGAGRK